MASIAEKILEIKNQKDTLVRKVEEGFGIPLGTETLASAVGVIDNIDVYSVGDSSFAVTEGKSTTFPTGYYLGGTITGLTNNELDAAKYRTQAKSCTPNKTTQVISPDNDKDGTLEDGEYYALSAVTVNPIPAIYADTSDATQDVNNNIVSMGVHPDLTVYARSSDGKSAKKITGQMPVNTPSTQKLTVADNSYDIPAGFHSSGGTVIVDSEEPYIDCPTQQGVSPTEVTSQNGKFMSKVYIGPLPLVYANTSLATVDEGALSGSILSGVTVFARKSNGLEAKKITGTMSNRGSINRSIDGIMSADSTDADGHLYCAVPAGYHDGDGKVYFDDSTILALLNEI